MIAMPDPSTMSLIPWRPEQEKRWLGCSATSAFPGRPMRAIRAGSCAGRWSGRRRWVSTLNIGPELEYFYFRSAKPDGGVPEILDEGGYFDLTTLDAGSDVRRETILALEQLQDPRRVRTPRGQPFQHEVDMRYKDALAMSDDCMTYRITVKEYAMKYGWRDLHAEAPGGGERLGHARPPVAFQRRPQRVLRRRRPVLPLRHRQGLHRRPAQHARRSPLFAQWVNSYKRLVPGFRGTRSICPGHAATARP